MESPTRTNTLLVDPAAPSSHQNALLQNSEQRMRFQVNKQAPLISSDQLKPTPLNWAKYQDLEQELNQDNLKDFISSIGAKYKQQLRSEMKKLTEEKEELDAIAIDLQRTAEIKSIQAKKATSQREADEKEIQKLKQDIEELNASIKEKNTKLQATIPDLKKFQEAIDQKKRQMTPNDLKALYQFLEKRTDEHVVFVMEALVGLLRGQQLADHKSVELYIKKHEGFIIGLSRIDYKNLNVEYCTQNLKMLGSKYNHLFRSEEYKKFEPFRKLLSDLSIAGLIAHDIDQLEKKIATKQAQIAQKLNQIERLELLISKIALEETLKEDFEVYNSEQMQFFKKRSDKLSEEIEKIQGKLANFEQDFFQGI